MRSTVRRPEPILVSSRVSRRIDMSTAEVINAPVFIASRRRISGGLGSAIMAKSRVCRRLFDDITEEERRQQEEYDQDLEAEQRQTMEAHNRRWGFDFERGVPLNGCWERVQSEEVHPMYREASAGTLIMPPRPRSRIARHRIQPSSARSSESAEQSQSMHSLPLPGLLRPVPVSTASTCDVTTSNDFSNATSVDQRLETETASTTVSVPVRAQQQSQDNNQSGLSNSSLPSAGSGNSNHVKQSKISAFFPHRKRSRSASGNEDVTGPAKQRKRSSPALPDRPQSAPAAMATAAASS